MNCVVCNKKLKTAASKAAGAGPVCSRKLTPEAREEIARIIAQGFDCRLIGGNVIQMVIPESPGEWPNKI